MIATRVVRLIEKHSDDLAKNLTDRLHRSARTAGYLHVPREELLGAVHELYRNLGEWMMTKTETDVEGRWVKLGRRRYEQGVPLPDFVMGILMSKETLWTFMRSESAADHILEILGEMEFLQLLDGFFDRAIFFAVTGYEQARTARTVVAA